MTMHDTTEIASLNPARAFSFCLVKVFGLKNNCLPFVFLFFFVELVATERAFLLTEAILSIIMMYDNYEYIMKNSKGLNGIFRVD